MTVDTSSINLTERKPYYLSERMLCEGRSLTNSALIRASSNSPKSFKSLTVTIWADRRFPRGLKHGRYRGGHSTIWKAWRSKAYVVKFGENRSILGGGQRQRSRQNRFSYENLIKNYVRNQWRWHAHITQIVNSRGENLTPIFIMSREWNWKTTSEQSTYILVYVNTSLIE